MGLVEGLLLAVEHAEAGAGLHDGPTEQALVHRRADLREHAARARRLAEDGDILRVAAECGDVLTHPLDAGVLVQESEVRIRGVVLTRLRLFAQPLMGQETEYVEPVGHRNHHHAATRERGAVEFFFCGATGLIRAAMNPHHYRQRSVCNHPHVLAAAAQRRGPHVHIQTVLIEGDGRIRAPFTVVEFVRITGRGLRTGGGEVMCHQCALPRLYRLRRTPTQIADRRCGEWDAAEDCDLGFRRRDAFDGAAAGMDDA